MELTLRKANALQSLILEKINSVELTELIEVNEFQNAQEVLDAAEVSLQTAIQNKVELWNAYYEIRAALGKTNASCGINYLLADLAKAEKLMQLYKMVSSKHIVRENMDVLNGKLNKIKNENGNRDIYSSRGDTVRSGVLNSVESYQDKVSTLSKEKVALNDKLLELNITNKIVLTSTTEGTLKENKIL